MAVLFVRKAKRRANRPVPAEEAPLPVLDPSVPATTGWLVRGKDGRLTAYAPGDGGVLRWTETRPGGPDWTGPDLIPAPGMLPYLAVAQGEDGYVHLVGLRRERLADGQTGTDVVYALQYQTGRAVRDWRPLGTPYPNDPSLAGQIGLPSAVVDSDGSLNVFVRNAGGGVCARSQAKTGAWNAWADLKGSGVRGTVSAAITGDGRVEVLAPTAEGLLRWEREKPGVRFERADDVPLRAAPDSPTAVETDPEAGLTHFWHDAGDRTVRAWRPSLPEGAGLGDGTGTGPVAVLRTVVDGHDCTVLAHRDEATGRPALAAYPTGDEKAGATWTLTGSPSPGAPSLALDGAGRVVMAVVGADGALWVARQKPESGLALGAWERAVS
ncbi:hypothetical protein [Streptomyces roseolilacinus]|uniref:PLL-like beta propeller domain-containing protein n=1 Tax=Streptomyces roseolilacinus TaxID=66904 RepID=A0A918B3H9_9ACTN|nr:hypothetical protein [Streptomyces roseolilacinus]GGQ14387.1 hypothetical protein GCM10010249_36200 [Streptomyces roseolilacinus]